jgi:hypothetical protein
MREDFGYLIDNGASILWMNNINELSLSQFLVSEEEDRDLVYTVFSCGAVGMSYP